MELNKIYCMDCLDLMKDIPDNYFDLVFTDPPYGINICSNGKVGGGQLADCKDYGKQEWDKNIPSADIFKEMCRVSKNQIIFGGNYFTDFLKPSSCWIIWDKDNSGNFADCELAWTSFNKAARLFKFRWNGMLQEHMNWKEKRFHPTQKPVALGRWVLERFAEPNNIVFDPFCGSGSFLLACKQKGFKFVGCDKEQSYVDIANERLNQSNLNKWNNKEMKQ